MRVDETFVQYVKKKQKQKIRLNKHSKTKQVFKLLDSSRYPVLFTNVEFIYIYIHLDSLIPHSLAPFLPPLSLESISISARFAPTSLTVSSIIFIVISLIIVSFVSVVVVIVIIHVMSSAVAPGSAQVPRSAIIANLPSALFRAAILPSFFESRVNVRTNHLIIYHGSTKLWHVLRWCH